MGVQHSKCSGFEEAMGKASCCDMAQKILDAQPNWITRPSRRTKCPRHENRVRSPTPYPRRKHRSPTPYPAGEGRRLHRQLCDEDYALEDKLHVETETESDTESAFTSPTSETGDQACHPPRRNRFERTR